MMIFFMILIYIMKNITCNLLLHQLGCSAADSEILDVGALSISVMVENTLATKLSTSITSRSCLSPVSPFKPLFLLFQQVADLETLKQSSRLVHYCATPLLFDPIFRKQIQEEQIMQPPVKVSLLSDLKAGSRKIKMCPQNNLENLFIFLLIL